MIRTFADAATRRVFERKPAKMIPPTIYRRARRKLLILDAAAALDDLRSPPGNRLEALSGDRADQHSIRINQQWRICFVWRDDHAHQVEIVDYH